VRRERIEVVSAWVGTGGGVGALAAWLLADNFASSVGSYTGIGSLIGLLVGLIRAYTERAVPGGVSSRTVAITRIRSQLLASGFDLPEALYEKCPTDLVLAHSSSGDSPALSRIGVLRTLDRAAYRLVMCGRVGCGIGEAAVAAALTLLDRADSNGDGRIPALLVARSYTGNLGSWIEKELCLRYGLDRTDASKQPDRATSPVRQSGATPGRRLSRSGPPQVSEVRVDQVS
jgi:hypothetical protein